ncbi:hypothetical protein OAK91_04530 [Planctomycetaceae bacterium]|nr:hypothetical protein [Planctomycetaceae bacterium]
MTYSQIWDLDSLYPNPQTAEFQAIWDQFLTKLESLSTESDLLPAISQEAASVNAWADFVSRWAEVRGQYWELSSLAGCHAAADAGNTEYRTLEAKKWAMSLSLVLSIKKFLTKPTFRSSETSWLLW